LVVFLTLIRSITRHEVSGRISLSFLEEYIFEPASCPRKNAGTVKKKVIISKSFPDKIRNAIIKSTGK
jgi:hypothetical protein